MKHLKRIAAAALATATLTATLGAVGASATILEVGGATKNEAVEIVASMKAGTSATLKDTFGFSSNTCTKSEVKGSTVSPFTGATVTAPVSTLTFSSCERAVTVHKGGTLHVAFTSGTNGTVSSSGAEVTTGSPFGELNCQTETGKHLGTLTGVKEGHATMDISANLSCSGISSVWQATYTFTAPTGLGVSKEPSTPSTILEVGGTPKTEAVEINASLKAGTSTSLKDTFDSPINTCTGSEVKAGTDSPFTGTTVTGGVDTLSFSFCDRFVAVHKGGTLHVSRIAGTTNGTVTSSGTEVTTNSPFGTLNCKTGSGTHLGTLTGAASGHASIDVNAVFDCSSLSTRWQTTYTVTSPTGLGVTA